MSIVFFLDDNALLLRIIIALRIDTEDTRRAWSLSLSCSEPFNRAQNRGPWPPVRRKTPCLLPPLLKNACTVTKTSWRHHRRKWWATKFLPVRSRH